MEVMNAVVAPSTQRSYAHVEGRWKGFMLHRFPMKDIWLRGVDRREQRIILVNFMKSESDEHHQISTVMGGLRHIFRTRLADLSIFEDDVVVGARKALKPRGQEVSILTEQRMRAPFTLELLRWSRSRYWTGDIDDKMTYIGASLQYALVWRVSEVLSDEHGLLTEDVAFITFEHQHILAPQLADISSNSIRLVQIISRSSKTRGSRGKTEFISRSDSDSNQLVDDLIEWAKSSGVQNGDFFLSRYKSGRNKRLTRRMVTELVKTCARQYGLPDSRYSTHSLRIGGPTEMLAAGVSPSEILLASGHESDAGLLYQLNSMRIRKPLQVLGTQGTGLTSSETLDMLPRKLQPVQGSDPTLVLRFPAALLSRLDRTSNFNVLEDDAVVTI